MANFELDEKVKLDEEYFTQTLSTYKEDINLGLDPESPAYNFRNNS